MLKKLKAANLSGWGSNIKCSPPLPSPSLGGDRCLVFAQLSRLDAPRLASSCDRETRASINCGADLVSNKNKKASPTLKLVSTCLLDADRYFFILKNRCLSCIFVFRAAASGRLGNFTNDRRRSKYDKPIPNYIITNSYGSSDSHICFCFFVLPWHHVQST